MSQRLSSSNVRNASTSGGITTEMRCVDMHFHTQHSDGAARFSDIIPRIKSRDIGIAITDHNTITGVLSIKRKYPDAFIIPGIEIKIKGGYDFLAYFPEGASLKRFFKKELEPYKKGHWVLSQIDISYKRLIEVAKKYDCLLSIAHPSKYPETISKEMMQAIDCIEVMNGGSTFEGNKKVRIFAESNKKLITGGSDGHSIYELGNILTCAEADSISNFLKAVKFRKVSVKGNALKYGKPERVVLHAKNILRNLARWK